MRHESKRFHGIRRTTVLCLCLIISAAVAMAADDSESVSRHWAFQTLRRPVAPAVVDASRVRSPIDRFVLAKLAERGLSLNKEADKPTLIRRVAFDLTGLPPAPSDLADFVADDLPDAYEQMVERYLASPHYGERWGKWWLDVAGYADSNGYFNADSDRPLAYRYRDYVIRAMNVDKPFDQFIREQIAGDELSGFDPNKHERHATPEMIDLLEATHFLRNSPDGSGESDGNPEEVMIDRYFALEGAQQILGSSLLGLTIQCSKCHDHKFEPITQREFYQLQAYLHPVFNMQKWLKPNERFTHAALPGEVEAWEAQQREAEARVAALRTDFTRWLREHRPVAGVLFSDDFDGPEATFLANWSNTAPGDDAPGGTGVVALISLGKGLPTLPKPEAPAAVRVNSTLQIIEGGPSGDKWISTKRAFDWTPNQPGEWIQVTFDLLDNKVSPDDKPAERIAFFLALHDFNDNSTTAGGNILIDGNPAGGAAVHLDYPGTDQSHRGVIGKSGYAPGRNFGVRVTNLDGKKFKLEQLVDWLPEERAIELTSADLPDGGFGFEFCCNRSFIVDNVTVESSTGNTPDEAAQAALKTFRTEYESRRKSLADAVGEIQKRQSARPGKIAWASNVVTEPPNVPILLRGNVTTPGDFVQPTPLRVISGATLGAGLPTLPKPLTEGLPKKEKTFGPGQRRGQETRAERTSGSRIGLADWLTRSDSPASALMARVQINRVWERHFGRGLVATLDNLGVSGAAPSHPELLEWLASEFSNFESDSSNFRSLKRLHREILCSATYRQSSQLNETAFAVDPDNRLLWRQPVRRLDAESIRDGMLFVSGSLERRLGGPYVPTQRSSAAEVVVNESHPEARRRSVYLQQRRTQTLSLLNLFDAPAVTFNCVQRPTTTMPLQSLSQLNSEFSLNRAAEFARRLDREARPDPRHRARLAFELATGHSPGDVELRASLSFLEEQTRAYEPAENASPRAWVDLCQMLLSSNGFLYVE